MRAAVRAELAARPPDEGPDLAREILALRDARARVEGLRAVLARKEDPTVFAADAHAEVRARALATGRVALPEARAALGRRDGWTRACALECLRDAEEARRLARDSSVEVRIACARVAEDEETVARLLRDREWRVRLAAVRAAERLRALALVPELIRVVGGEPGRTRARAAAALETLTQVPFGEDSDRWERWWKGLRPGYALPPPRPEKSRAPEHTSAAITFRRIPVVSRRLCFVLDASRSMSRPAPGGRGQSRWQLVLRDLEAVLAKLPSDARFNVVLFRTEVEAWRRRLVRATSGARRSCLEWIRAEEPAGWTNLFDAVALALEDDDVDALYVLTDGVPSQGAETERAEILAELDFLNRYRLVQINCVQAGGAEGLSKRWEGFLDELAEAHEGVAVRE